MATKRQTRQHKKAFLDAFRLTGNVSRACRETDTSRAAVYDWINPQHNNYDAEFEAEYRDAELESTQIMEEEARRRAVDGVPRIRRTFHRGELVDEYEEIQYSDTLLMFLLKARAPEKYKDRIQNEHVGKDGAPAVFTLTIDRKSDDDRSD